MADIVAMSAGACTITDPKGASYNHFANNSLVFPSNFSIFISVWTVFAQFIERALLLQLLNNKTL
jgi:hypothetical protein